MPVIRWNGKDFPEGLSQLPAGAYVIERLDDALTADEEQGPIEALASLRAGRGVPHVEVEARQKAFLDELTAEAEKLGLGY